MIKMTRPRRGDSVLDIGCGSGRSLIPFLGKNISLTGIDPSPYMLDIARKNLKNSADLHRGFAEDLPFDDNSFNHTYMITSLEFTKNPIRALEEACRVTKDQLFLGLLNKYSVTSLKRIAKGVFTETVYNRARFFGILEIKQIVNNMLGDVPVSWKTLSYTPGRGQEDISVSERFPFLYKYPFGAFLMVAILMVPKFRARPLSLKYASAFTP